MPLSPTDAQLVKRTLRGERDAYAELVRAHQARAIATAHALCGDFEAAQDIAQEAFLQGFRSLRNLRKPAAFGAWLHGIIRNLSLKHLNREPPATASLERDDVPEPSDPPPQPSNGVLALVGALPVEHREVLAARYLQELSYQEIGQMLGITAGNARVRCFRAKQALREALAREEA